MHKISLAKLKALRWMCGKSRKNKIRIEHFWEHLGITLIGDKL